MKSDINWQLKNCTYALTTVVSLNGRYPSGLGGEGTVSGHKKTDASFFFKFSLIFSTKCILFFNINKYTDFLKPLVKPQYTDTVFKRSGYIPVKNFLNTSFFGKSGYTWVMQLMSRMRSPRPAESRSFLVKGWIFWIFLPPSEQKKRVTQQTFYCKSSMDQYILISLADLYYMYIYASGYNNNNK